MPSAEKVPGTLGTMTFGIEISRAIETACSGPAPPNATMAVSRGSTPFFTDAAMSLAVRAVSVKKGVDPRDTAMVAFGGAGPLHAVSIAREISIPKVIVPKVPGTFSALGMLMASWRQDFVRTLYGLLGALEAGQIESAFSEL